MQVMKPCIDSSRLGAGVQDLQLTRHSAKEFSLEAYAWAPVEGPLRLSKPVILDTLTQP